MVEGAVDGEMARRVAADVRAHLRERHGIDVPGECAAAEPKPEPEASPEASAAAESDKACGKCGKGGEVKVEGCAAEPGGACGEACGEARSSEACGKGGKGPLSLGKLQRAFSPDGSGMIEAYWLPAMEAVTIHAHI